MVYIALDKACSWLAVVLHGIEKMLNSKSGFEEMLHSGEQVLWAAVSHQDLRLGFLAVPIVLAGAYGLLVMAALAAEGNWTKLTVIEGLLVTLALGGGIALILVLENHPIRLKTYYAVTNQRVLFRGGINNTERILDLRSLPEMRLYVKEDGRGRIVFKESERNASPLGQGALMALADGFDPAFENLENVRQVYTLIQRAQADLK